MTKGQRSKFSGYQCNIGAPDKMGYKRQQTIEAALSHHSGYTRETGRSTSQHTPYFGLQVSLSWFGNWVLDTKLIWADRHLAFPGMCWRVF